ncbi:hypothetical protein [Xanthomonas medicagonis]|uniref:hypothetical protein n=1 Tax=Xanthomonas medicagonis TaxID=3160841 RepID=UPI0035117511
MTILAMQSHLDATRAHGWSVIAREPPGSAPGIPWLPPVAFERLPSDYAGFLHAYRAFGNADATAWFLMLEDYAGATDASFAWDEFEAQSLAAALDEEAREEIRRFWRRHLPILISLKDGYSFLALDLSEPGSAPVMIGSAPEYEDVSPFCRSIEELFAMVSAHLCGQRPHPVLDRLL